jgi:hypothetical protein
MRNSLCLLCLALCLLQGCANTPSGEKNGKDLSDQDDIAAMQEPAAGPDKPFSIPANALRLESNAYEHSVLLPFFPRLLAGMQRHTLNGESYIMGAGLVSALSASYSAQDHRLSVTLHDVGDHPEVLAALADWTELPEDEKSEDVVHRSFLYKEQPALIRYGPGRMGTFNVLCNNRFVVGISGRNVGIAQLEKAMDDLQIERLK